MATPNDSQVSALQGLMAGFPWINGTRAITGSLLLGLIGAISALLVNVSNIALPHAATVAALQGMTPFAGNVVLDTNGATYTHQIAPCSLGANGSGDGGTQFKDSGRGCWVVAPFVPITTGLFMLDATGATDVTTGLQAALAAAGARNKPLQLCGTFMTSAALTLVSGDAVTNTTSGIIGCGSGNAILLTTNATQDGIFLSGGSFGQMYGCVVKNLTIRSPSQNFKTAGAAVHLLYSNECRVEDNNIQGQYSAIYSDSGALNYIALNTITGSTAASAAVGSTAISLHGNDVGTVVFSNYSNNASNNAPSVGISLSDNVNGEYIEDNSMSNFNIGFNVNPCSVCKIQNIFSRQNAYDVSVTAGINFQADGPIYRFFSVNDWSAATQNGPCLQTAGTGSAPGVPGSPAMSNWQFESFQCRGNSGNGIVLGGNLKGATFSNLVATANNNSNAATVDAGVVLNAPVSHVSFLGGIVGPTAEEFNYQDYGFILGSGVDYVQINGVDVTGNRTGAMVNVSTGAHNVIVNDPGINPVTPVTGGATELTVGASPWTYTAGPSPETLYVFNGTCSLIQQSTAGVGTACSVLASYQLGPNEPLTITYSAAPTVNRIIH